MSSCPILPDQLDANVLRNVGSQAPTPLKLMTARGLAPMAPRDTVTAQFVLTFDEDESVAQAAEKSLSDLDLRIANAVLSDEELNPNVLGYLAKATAINDAYAEKLLLNPSTPSPAFGEVAKVCSEPIAEIIANNQARLLEVPEIARSLVKNSNVIKSTIDRVIDFLVRNGVILDDLPQFEHALLRLTGAERIKAAAAVELPRALIDPEFLDDDEDDDDDDDEDGDDRLLIEEDDDGEYDEEEPEEQNVEQLVRTLNNAQKVALASKTTRQVRALLMKDTNRIVALAAITSPAVAESEIIGAAQSRTVHADVIQHIATDKKNNWTRIYAVKLAVVQNPKTLLPVAMKNVPMLNKRDLKSVSKSKNVPMGVRNLANEILKRTSGR